MIYLIGLSHDVQAVERGQPRTAGQEEFERILRRSVSDTKAGFIAEEYSECVQIKRNKLSIAKSVADDTGIQHAFCDPNDDERDAMDYWRYSEIWQQLQFRHDPKLQGDIKIRAMSIEVAVHFPKREQFWFEHLPSDHDRNGIFVCGDSHVESFGRLLSAEGVKSSELYRAVGMSQREIEEQTKIRAYIEAHPEVKNWSLNSS
jgi:hypothetical protein